jgi:uncharacterized circularly permuted ATP-grasp superfamily protein
VVEVDEEVHRVDVLYRRTNEERLIDDEGRPTAIGSAVLEPLRRGLLASANAFGAGVADDKLAHAYVERMIAFYLGEEPLVRSVPTFDLADPAAREQVLDRIDEMVVKPRAESGGQGVLVGPHADAEARERTIRAVKADPEAFVTADGDVALPGGLTRVALDAGALVVNSSQDGGAKDTWVLA